MKVLTFFAILFAPVAAAMAQDAQNSARPAIAAPARHLVMMTRAGPNFAKLRDHMEEAKAHQAIYERLAAEGHTIAGGAFEGQPVLGMTIWTEGVDEAKARELIKDDQLPKLGIVEYEFRVLGVRMGSFKK
ncbi:hypothetical protein IC614_05145 [Allosphingosinicella flava]|uniref:YCII-related domain-containing protein n=1 Tax=Allosphingosinicella flava TaxID=2771430 RepID=A0A7T2GLH4_9SPHN|nr:hypothetical protein [Sphingosinicella flava]QPQ55967.1 hypothetical protein IC614_05145 [Sphingosinicella flava]